MPLFVHNLWERGVFMKKNRYFALFLLILLPIFVFGCENATFVRTAVITEITAVGSKNYGVRISFARDSRMEEKEVDVQVKFNKTGELTFWEENGERLNFVIEEVDEWYSLANLIAVAKNREGFEDFEKHNEARTRTYLFNFDGRININMRVVAGEKELNSAETGYVLVESEPISDQFTLKIQ